MKITPKTVKTALEILIIAGKGIANAIRERKQRRKERREGRREDAPAETTDPRECETCEGECVHKP